MGEIMNIHALIDEMAIRLGAMFFAKYFRDGRDSAPLATHLQATAYGELLGLSDMPDELEMEVDTAAGRLTAVVRRERWRGSDAPAVIYHHGASEIPYDYGFSRIFPADDARCRRLNLFAVRAPWHSSRADFAHGNADLQRWMAMLAASVTLLELLVSALRTEGVGTIALSGSSLGGFVTNLHHVFYDSADLYLPMLAGLAMDEAFLDSIYARAVVRLDEEERQLIRRLLNFSDEFSRCDSDHVFPLLARYDRILTWKRQSASYGGLAVQTLEKGHTTGAIAYDDLRDHVFRNLDGLGDREDSTV